MVLHSGLPWVRRYHHLHDCASTSLCCALETFVPDICIQISAFFLAIKGVQNIISSDGPLTPSSLFTNSIFRNIVLSLLATLGLYLIASLIFVSDSRLVTEAK